MSTIDQTRLPLSVERAMPGAWEQSDGHASFKTVVLHVSRVLLVALALAGLVYGGFTAAQALPTGIAIVLGWLVVSFVAAPLVGLVLKAATSDITTPAPIGSQRGPLGHLPNDSARG